MIRRNIVMGSIAALLALVIGLSVWSLTAAQDSTSAQPYLGIGLVAADNGIGVREVVAGSPAEAAGLKIGDVITDVDGKSVTANNIHDIIAGYKVGDTVKLTVERGSDKLELSATLAAQPETPSVSVQPAAQYPVLGVELQDSDTGVLIHRVVPNSAADKAGLKAGDIIEKIGDTEIKTASAAADAVHALKVGDSVAIQIQRDGKSQTVNATLEAGTAQIMPPVQVPFGNDDNGANGNNPFERGFGIIYNGNDKTWQIHGLSQDSDLYKAGLRAGDVIKTFDGKAYDPSELRTYLKTLDSSKDVTLSVDRSGSSQDITVSAGALSSMAVFSMGMGGMFNSPFGQVGGGARLGVQFVTLDAQKAKDHNVTVTDGALITDIITGTPAEKAGLKVNDIITAVDGDKVDAEHTLRDRLYAYEPDDTIKLDVLRDGSTQQISVTLDQGSLGDSFPFFNMGPNGFQFFGPDGSPMQQPTPEATPNM